MNLALLPYRLALLAASGAFAAVWSVGLCAQTPAHQIAFRSLIAALLFWAIGQALGRAALRCLADAMSEQIAERSEKTRGGVKK